MAAMASGADPTATAAAAAVAAWPPPPVYYKRYGPSEDGQPPPLPPPPVPTEGTYTSFGVTYEVRPRRGLSEFAGVREADGLLSLLWAAAGSRCARRSPRRCRPTWSRSCPSASPTVRTSGAAGRGVPRTNVRAAEPASGAPGTADRVAALKQMTRSLVFNYLELLERITSNGTDWVGQDGRSRAAGTTVA